MEGDDIFADGKAQSGALAAPGWIGPVEGIPQLLQLLFGKAVTGVFHPEDK